MCSTGIFPALRLTFEKLFFGIKVRQREQKIGVRSKTIYEIDPRLDGGGILSVCLSTLCSAPSAYSHILTESWDLNCRHQLFIVCINSFTDVSSRIILPQIFDEKHDCCITRLFLSVNPSKCKQKQLARGFGMVFCALDKSNDLLF